MAGIPKWELITINKLTCFFRTSCWRWPYLHQYAKCCELCQSVCLAFWANDTYVDARKEKKKRFMILRCYQFYIKFNYLILYVFLAMRRLFFITKVVNPHYVALFPQLGQSSFYQFQSSLRTFYCENIDVFRFWFFIWNNKNGN